MPKNKTSDNFALEFIILIKELGWATVIKESIKQKHIKGDELPWLYKVIIHKLCEDDLYEECSFIRDGYDKFISEYGNCLHRLWN